MSAPSPKTIRPRSTRNKRSASPGSAAATSKKGRKNSPASSADICIEPPIGTQQTTTCEVPASTLPVPSSGVVPLAAVLDVPLQPTLPFKDPLFTYSIKGLTASRKTWKTLRQITSAERMLPWKPDEASYSSIDAPPSLKPAKKYSDLSGFPAKYTDPQTKLRYADTDEFSRSRMLTVDVVTGLLTLRRAHPELQ